MRVARLPERPSLTLQLVVIKEQCHISMPENIRYDLAGRVLTVVLTAMGVL